MRTRDSLTLSFTPLLVRIALGTVFLFSGANKFQLIDFKGEPARDLAAMGIGKITKGPGPKMAPRPDKDQEDDREEPGVTEEDPIEDDSIIETDPLQPVDEALPPEVPESIEQAVESGSFVEDVISTGANQDDELLSQDDDASASEIDDGETDVGEDDPEPVANRYAVDPDAEYEVSAMALEGLTILLDKAGHPLPRVFAWMAAITEALGGAMVLIGLLSRFWSMGLLIAMVYAFWLTIWPAWLGNIDPLGGNVIQQYYHAFIALDRSQMNTAFLQWILFLSAAAIVLGGAGTLSVDHLLWGSSSRSSSS